MEAREPLLESSPKLLLKGVVRNDTGRAEKHTVAPRSGFEDHQDTHFPPLISCLESDRARTWSDREVVDRHGKLCRHSSEQWKQIPSVRRADRAARWRARLSDLNFLDKLGIAGEHWVETVVNYHRHFFTMVGHVHRIAVHCARTDRQQAKGTSWATTYLYLMGGSILRP